MTGSRDRARWIAVMTAVLLPAAWLRLYALDTIPPGMQIDEVINVQVVRQIAQGWRPVFIPQGWGREPLYHYLSTLLYSLIGHPSLALRLIVVFAGLALIPAVAILARRLGGQRMGVLAGALVAFVYWPVFASRYPVRGITLALISTLAILAAWRAIGRCLAGKAMGYFALAGVLLGLSFYTYQSARLLPLVFLALGVWLWLFDRPRFHAAWRGLLIALAIALVIGAPMFAYLLTHSSAEADRSFMLEPVQGVLQGDWGPLKNSMAFTLGMFSFDAGGWHYNVPGHPIFPPVVGALFYIGILVCCLRLRNLPRFTVLVWLVVGMLPSLVTSGSHYFRLIGALVPALVLPAIGLIDVVDWAVAQILCKYLSVGGPGLSPDSLTRGRLVPLSDRLRQNGEKGVIVGARHASPLHPMPHHNREETCRHNLEKTLQLHNFRYAAVVALAVGVALAAVGQSLATTWRDYFTIWAVDSHVREFNEADLREIGRYLDRTPDSTPVVIASLAAEDVDPDSFGAMIERADIDQRWFDASNAFVLPGGVAQARYISRPSTPLRPVLADYAGDAQLVLERRWPDGTASFTVRQLDVPAARQKAIERAGWPLDPEASRSARFAGRVQLLGYTVAPTATAGSVLRLLTTWRVLARVQPAPAGIFAHLLSADGRIVAQDDHLGFPLHSWRPDDIFVQFSRIELPGDLPPGRYTLQVGVYDKSTGARWPLEDEGEGDHLRLGQISFGK